MDPSPVPPTLSRPVWILPTVAASLAIALVALLALVVRHGDDHPLVRVAPSTSTSSTTFARDPNGPEGSRQHPFALGESGLVAGWRITVQSVGGEGSALTATVLLLWDGRDGAALGDATKLGLQVEDARGTLHPLGGTACPGDPAGDLAKVPPLDNGHIATVALCWTAPRLDRSTAALVAADSAVKDTAFYALA